LAALSCSETIARRTRAVEIAVRPRSEAALDAFLTQDLRRGVVASATTLGPLPSAEILPRPSLIRSCLRPRRQKTSEAFVFPWVERATSTCSVPSQEWLRARASARA